MNNTNRRINAAAVRRLPATLTITAAVLLGACTSSTGSTGSTRSNTSSNTTSSSAAPAGATTTTPGTPLTSPSGSDVPGTTESVVVVGATAVAVDGSSTSAPATDVSVTVPATDASAVVTTAAQSAPAGNSAGSPTDPCSLLSPDIAAAAIGVPVGDPRRVTDKGNVSCAYHAADPAVNRLVYLTTYAVVGSPSILASAAATFRDARSVPGLGDAADVSLQSQAVGVLVGTTVFALGVAQQNVDGTLQLLTEDQLVAVARAVVDGRS